MVLNEMIGSSTYTITDIIDPNGGFQFKASVPVDGSEHFGYGKSKMEAKSAAAEAAIKSLILKRLKASGQQGESNVKDIKIADDDTSLPWQHVASFALHKLFATWDEGPAIAGTFFGNTTAVSKTTTTTTPAATAASGTTTTAAAPVPREKKPAKTMPPNPELMNPIMLLNQQLPNATFIELSRAGNPPTVVFTYKCIVEGQSFIGRGKNKNSLLKCSK